MPNLMAPYLVSCHNCRCHGSQQVVVKTFWEHRTWWQPLRIFFRVWVVNLLGLQAVMVLVSGLLSFHLGSVRCTLHVLCAWTSFLLPLILNMSSMATYQRPYAGLPGPRLHRPLQPGPCPCHPAGPSPPGPGAVHALGRAVSARGRKPRAHGSHMSWLSFPIYGALSASADPAPVVLCEHLTPFSATMF